MPKLPEQYKELQEVVQQRVGSGSELIAPTGGVNRQSLQLFDINGDKKQEAVALFRNNQDEQPISVEIYELKNDSYELYCRIQESAENISSINYVDLNGDGNTEVIIGLAVGEGVLNVLSVYSITEGQAENILKRDYSNYDVFDVDSDGILELLLAVYNNTNETSELFKYDYYSTRISDPDSIILSSGCESVIRIKTGYASKLTPAVYVTSLLKNSTYMTDVVVCSQNKLVCLTHQEDAETSEDESTENVNPWAMPDDVVHVMDINEDGMDELPRYRTLSGEESYQVVDWYSFSELELPEYILTTYFSSSSGWYFEIPDNWDNGTLQISRIINSSEKNTRGILFSCNDGEKKIDLLRIYLFSSTVDKNLSEQSDVTPVMEIGGSMLAFSLEEKIPAGFRVSEEDIIQRLHTIKSEWIQ